MFARRPDFTTVVTPQDHLDVLFRRHLDPTERHTFIPSVASCADSDRFRELIESPTAVARQPEEHQPFTHMI